MLVVRIELHSAVTHKVTEIGRMRIWRVGGTRERGDYKMSIGRRNDLNKTQRTGEVLNYPRLSYNVWRLVTRALKSAFPEER